MSQHSSIWIAKPRGNHNGWSLPQPQRGINYCNTWSEGKESSSRKNPDHKEEDAYMCVNVIDWSEAVLSNSKGFSRLVRHCDDKSLNIVTNPKVFQEKEENHNIVVSRDSFVELEKTNNIKEQQQWENTNNHSDLYYFDGKAISETRKSSMGFPDSLFLTQIYNEEKYEKSQQIFSSRGMCTASLCTKKIVDREIAHLSYWTYCTRCDTVFDISNHAPGDYKNILIDSKLLCIIGWDKEISRQFNLSFRRLHGSYSRQYSSHLITPDWQSEFKNSNVEFTQFGISLKNSQVFGRVALDVDLSNTVFDCVLLDSGQPTNNSNDSNNNNHINVSLLLICKALPDMTHCFEFIKIALTFSDGYKNLLSCCYQRDTNVLINGNVNLKTVLDSKNECLFGWSNKAARFKTECIKIKNDQADTSNDDVYNRLLIIVINTSSHHIILYNCDLNNYIILKLNSITNDKSSKIFPCVCWVHVNFTYFFIFFSFASFFCKSCLVREEIGI